MSIIQDAIICVMGILSNPVYTLVLFTAIIFAVGAILTIRCTKRTPRQIRALTYVHISMLFFPVTLLITYMNCGGYNTTCGMLPVLSYVVLSGFIAIVVGGYLLPPLIYPIVYRAREIRSGKLHDSLWSISAESGIEKPKLLIVDAGSPIAFSISGIMPEIFLSVGILELLDGREIEAVMLHELSHISGSASQLNFISNVAKVFSPFYTIAGYGRIISEEERNADLFASRAQHTQLHLNSAKRKIRDYARANLYSPLCR